MYNFNEIIDGLLLSDGNLNTYKHVKNFRYSQSCKHKYFMYHVMNKFLEVGFNFGPKSPYKSIHNKNKGICWYICTSVDAFFTQQRQRWYKDKIKIVPEDILITPESVKYWYYGDGGINYCKNNIQKINLSTDGFTLDEVMFLVEKLRFVGVTCKYEFHIKNKYPRVVINRSKAKDFLEYIGQCDVQCYEYKWIIYNRKLYDEYKNKYCSCFY